MLLHERDSKLEGKARQRRYNHQDNDGTLALRIASLRSRA